MHIFNFKKWMAVLLAVSLFIGIPAPAVYAAGIITTVAGTGTSGYSGDEGAATSAQFMSTYGIALDAAGNLYIVDFYNHRIRKMDTSGIITTVAGTGTRGYSGDGGAATSAQLNYPCAVAVDAAGNLYISDSGNYRIRKVDTSGTITTVAGAGTYGYSGDEGAATLAKLQGPYGVAVDVAGNLYISDYAVNAIRKVDASGIITTVAGTGTGGYSGDGGSAVSAQLNSPRGVAADAAGNLYIADTANNVIRKVDTSGIITTAAGTGTSGYSGDGEAALSARLNNPVSVAVDAAGNLYITDMSNYKIRKVDTAGIITTVAGAGTPGYSGDGGAATSAQLQGPIGVAVDAAGNLYISDTGSRVIRKVEASGTEEPGKTLTADTTNNDVDHEIEITFAADADFENVITGVSFNGQSLTAGSQYTVGSGRVTLHPGGTENTALRTPATANVVITAVEYENSSVSQTIRAGEVAGITVTTQPVPGTASRDAFSTQPVVTLKDQYGNICADGPSAAATVTAAAKNGTGSWNIGGTTTFTASAGVAAFTGLACTTTAAGTGAITFSAGTVTVDSDAFDMPADAPFPGGAYEWQNVGGAGFTGGMVEDISLYVDEGTPYVAYIDKKNSKGATVMKYIDNTWENVGEANFSDGEAAYISLHVDEGTPYVAYADRGDENSYKATVVKYNGSGWEAVGNAGFSAGMASFLSMHVYDGTPYVAYSDGGDLGKATVMKYNGSGWELVGSAGFSDGGVWYTSLYVDDEGTPYVAYMDHNKSEKATVMKYNGSGWEPVGGAGFSDGRVDYISLYVDDEDTPYVSYMDRANGDKATVMKYNGSGWEPVGGAGFSEGKISQSSLYVDGGTPCVAYSDGGNLGKATVMKYNGSGWEPVGIAGFSAGYTNYISLYVDEGTPYVAYADFVKSSKATVMKYGPVASMPTYELEQISDQSLTGLAAGYAAGTQETRTLMLTSIGTGDIDHLTATLSGDGSGNFVITQPLTTTLNAGAPATTFTIKAKDGLAAGTYTGTVTVSADSMTDMTFTVTQAVVAAEAPVLQSAVAGDKHVTLIWSPVEGSVGYAVYARTASAVYAAPTATVTDSVYSYDVTGLTNGVTYYFVIHAIHSVGNSPNSLEVSAIPMTVPGAPTGVNASPGNGQATVSFTAPADNGGSPITGYIVTATPGGVTVNGTGTAITVTGLTNGTAYSFTVKAVNAAGNSIDSAASDAVTPYIPSGGGSSGGSQPSPQPQPSETSVNVLVNGKAENAGTATTSKEGGKTVTTIAVDETKLEQRLATEGNNAVVTIPVHTEADVVIGEVNGRMVKSMEDKTAVLEIKTETASYSLPARQLNIEAMAAQLGQGVELKDIKVRIGIAKSPAETVQVAERSAQKGAFTIAAPPMDFTITYSGGGKTIEINSFNAYVERAIAIPDGVDPGKITTGIVVEPDGSVRHVPTRISLIDDTYYAVINSLTNSTYSVVWHPLEFKDAASHWAKEAINDMGSRMVVTGTDNDLYEPDRDITRAEFATVMVRALGLKPGTGSNFFSDVSASQWYCEYIQTASQYGIVSGYGDGRFGPMDKITREQAMVMVSRAMKITGLKAGLAEGDVDTLLAGFGDSEHAAAYAKESIAACIKTGIVSGKSGKMLAPKDEVTRAEVAVIVRRLLQKSDLI